MSFDLRTQSADPATPAAGKNILFVENVNRRRVDLDDKGVRNVLANRDLPNALRNSGFWFAQRQAPGTLTTYSNTTGRAIAPDGWGVTNENASVQFIRTDTVAGLETGLQAQYYGTFSKITSTGKIVVSQVVEHRDALAMRGRTVRFQVKLKASSAKTLKIAVIQNNVSATADTIASTFIAAFGANTVDPTLGTNLAFLAPKTGVTPDNATAGANAASCAVTTSWQRFGVVVDVPTNAKNLIVLVWTDSQFAAADSFSISEAALTDGFEIQDWSPLSYQAELARVQRHYVKTFDVDTAPVQNAGAATGAVQGIIGKAAATALAVVIPWRYPVPLRVAGVTVTQYSPESAAAAPWRTTGTTPAVQTAQAVANSTTTGIVVTATGDANGAVGDRVHVHLTVDSEI